ncbi:hypothetical protein Tco_0769743 [Tanacetum coccineum]|uniref:Uncharacterized protein n=1 Tax=Tanacetum coccineum TaxID=301880 RepID=A0ABQ4ZB69_9ASTR
MDSEDKEKDSEKRRSRKKSLARKRAGEKQSEESTKRQKIEDDVEKEELKAYLDLGPREEFAMEIESLATKYPIVDWKTHVLTENFMYYQIFRADGSFKNYKIFSEMLDDFDKQDVLDLHRPIFINQHLGDVSRHKKIFVNPSHTKKIFANMKKEGKDFSRRITPLFETMTVQPTQDEGVDSGIPADSLQTPITTQPSSSRSQKKQSKRKQRKDAAVTQEETQQDDSIPTPSNDLPLSEAKDAQEKEIADLKKRVQRLERKKKSRTTGLKRLKKVGMSRRVESSEDQESLGDHEDASKQGRSIEDIDKDANVSLVDDT